MAESSLISIAQQFTGLPMRDLIGAPLMAAAEGNSAMAVSQIRFLLDTAFKKTAAQGGGGDTYEPVMITMKITRSVVEAPADPATSSGEIKVEETSFDLPLLTVLPLNSLAVDEVDIRFHMEVKSSFAEDTSKKSDQEYAGQGSFSAKVGYGPFSAEVTGSVSYKSSETQAHETHYQKSNSAQYDVHVHAGQLPLPPGVTTIIQAYTNAITPLSKT